jgi:hypothetical protein
MWTFFTILAAAWFAVNAQALRDVDAVDAGQLFLEIEPDEGGFHAIVIDVSDDSVLHITNTYPTANDAERAGRLWIDVNE